MIQIDSAEEEYSPEVTAVFFDRSAKKRKQADIGTFLVRKHTLSDDMIRLVTELNFSMNQLVSSETLRRILTRAYPGDPAPPRSIANLRNLLTEKAEKVRVELRIKLRNIRDKGESHPTISQEISGSTSR